MINLENVTLVSIDSAKDYSYKSNIRLAAISRLIPEICNHIKFGDILIINPFNKNKDLITEKFETLWEFDWQHSGGIAWYNNFLIKRLPFLIKTEWYLIIQWDGFPRYTNLHWNNEFFNYPYLGGGHSLLNGGFSLRKTDVMQKIASCKENFNTGSEDNFYSKFFDNEFNTNVSTPFKIHWPPENVINDFCFFQDINYNNNQPTFGWHRNGFLSKEKMKQIYNEMNIFNESEINFLIDYSLLKELRNGYFDLNEIHSMHNIECNESFFDTY